MLLCAITDKPIYLDTTFQYLVRIQLQLDNNTRSKGGNIREIGDSSYLWRYRRVLVEIMDE